ncbi:DEAD/DEAH box helicase [Candidatus Thorarchaeota archaeon]|nr:MAG: DEAD/DEAH box helicase [Candidatus Thorarchaeota archaeon]
MNGFESLHADIVEYLTREGITKPTEIQEKAIPRIRSGGSALLLAPTGSGKTEASILPLLSNLYERKLHDELFGIYILYITPLRALNRDVFRRIEDLCEHLGITVAVRHGDTTQYFRRKQAITPPNLLITTPETLQAILPGKRMKYHLRSVMAVIVDEIHELAGSKRGTQLSLALERLVHWIGNKIQRVGLSATVGNANEIAFLLRGSGKKIHTLWAGYQERQIHLKVEMPQPNSQHIELGRQISYPPHSAARLERIKDLIESHQTTIVFTNTRSFAEVLGAKMRTISPPFEFDVHHGSLSKEVRLSAEDRLKRGVSKAIIATSSLELGIDIGLADLVIQYSSPREVSRAVQRIGRSGHRVGRVSKGIIISTMNVDDITESAVILKRARINKVEPADIPQKTWDVLCQQVSGVLLDTGEIRKSELLRIIKGAYPFREVNEKELDRLLDFMVRRRFLLIEDDLIKRYGGTLPYYYEHLSTIPDVQQVRAVDIATRTGIGVLDEDFVTESVETGFIFVIRGRPWRVVSIDEEREEVLCAPVTDTQVEAPRWIGEMIPVPFEVATEVADVWERLGDLSYEASSWLETNYMMNETSSNYLVESVTTAKEQLGSIPTETHLIIETIPDGIVFHAPFGTKTNDTIGVVLAALLTTRLGKEVAVETDPYRILLTASGGIDAQYLLDVFSSYQGAQISTILRLAVRQTQTFASRFIHVGRRMGIIRRTAKFKEIPSRRLIDVFESSPVFDEAMKEILREKLDENRMLEVFEKIDTGEIQTVISKRKQPSLLARLIIEEKTRFEVMGEISDEDEVLRFLEERLLSRKFRLICMAKNDWNSVRTISTLDDEITCPICNSRMIAAVRERVKNLPTILRKVKAGEMLSGEEKKRYENASLTASLVAQYGKKALLALAGRGIGPTTASRVLRPGQTDRLTLLHSIAKAEQEYERTRPFWD